MDSFPHFVRMNRDEIHRFEQYLASQNISVPMILRQLVEAREAAFEPDDDDQFTTNSQGAPKENPWTDAVLCMTCIDALVRVQSGVWNWWLQERARGPLDRMSMQSRVFRRLTLCAIKLRSEHFPIAGMGGNAERKPNRFRCLLMHRNLMSVLPFAQMLVSDRFQHICPRIR
jgi:hypothetical protein